MGEENNIPQGNSSEVSPNSNINSEIRSYSLKKTKLKKWMLIPGIIVFLILVGLVSWLSIRVRNDVKALNTAKVGDSQKASSSDVSDKDSSITQKPNIPNAIDPINPAAIPLGTGKVSTTPEVGYVDLCNFKEGSVAAEPSEPWINTANDTWDSETKPSVEGSVSWSNEASYTVTLSDSTRLISTNDLPIDHDTGVFPISSTDPAYQYDHNPNHIAAQPTTWELPSNPTAAASPSCTNDGPIGILNDGVFLFNALDANNRDAGATEIFDQWQGHPDSSNTYHHHMAPSFMLEEDSAKSSSTLIGYAIDGYGIYVERDSNGNLLTNANLDACHVRTSSVMWNGKMTYMYHYDVTLEYPYTVGCFHGTPIKTNISMNMANTSPPSNKPKPPPAK